MKISTLIALFISSFVLNIISHTASGQTITTVAGCGIGDDSLATRAELSGPVGICVDTAGNTYIAEQDMYRLRKVTPAGIITTYAGNGTYGHTGDGGQATAASIGTVYGVAADRRGNVFFTDQYNNCVRKIDASGIITTIAGTGVSGFSGDGGPATVAQLNSPIDVVVDTAGNVIFTDWLNDRVRKIDNAGVITTIVGDGGVSGSGNGGPATASELGRPFRVAMDNKGNLYVASVIYQCICKVDTGHIIHLICGTGAYAIGADGDGGPATAATMTSPSGLAVDTSGNVYFSDISNYRIRKIDMNTGIISNYAGNSINGYSGDGGAATAASITYPEDLACDNSGNLLICDPGNNLVRKVNTSGTISSFAGQAGSFGDGDNAVNAELNYPENLITDAAGNIYVADIIGSRIRMISTSGIITTVAGNGSAGYSGDGGPATAATFSAPSALAFDRIGNLYICDQDNHSIRKVTTSGTISTIAGTGTAGYGGDGGPAIEAQFHFPTGIAIDTNGNIYICDNNNQCIRMINPAGIINTVAGTPGSASYSGDGGPAANAQLSYPADISLDAMGNLYICDGGNSCIRKVDTSGMITTIAGSGSLPPGFGGDNGPATAAALYYPYGIRSDSAGNIYIADHENERIRLVTTDGNITTIAGNGTAGFSGDGGPAVAAMISSPCGVAVNPNGDIFIADANNARIRKVNLSVLSTPVVKKNIQHIAVYPNPAVKTIDILNAANDDIVIYDAAGREAIRTIATLPKQTLDVSGLASGIYLLQATNSNGEKTVVKLTKE